MDVSALLFGYSKALYSNWLFYKPDNLLIDCGEGVATALGNGGYAIERVLLTHGHLDHIAGLPSLIGSRAFGMGDNNKPLTVYHPKDDGYVADMRAYLQRTSARLPFQLTWVELEASDEVVLAEGSRHPRRVVTFSTRHIPGRLTLGYKIVEKRRRLKPEFTALSQDELRARAQQMGRVGAADLSEDYEATLVAFGGDGVPLNPEDVNAAELLVHEATLLDPSERKHQLHSTLDEATAVAADANVGALLANHFSGRYRPSDIKEAALEAATRHGLGCPLWCLFRDRLWNIVPASTANSINAIVPEQAVAEVHS